MSFKPHMSFKPLDIGLQLDPSFVEEFLDTLEKSYIAPLKNGKKTTFQVLDAQGNHGVEFAKMMEDIQSVTLSRAFIGRHFRELVQLKPSDDPERLFLEATQGKPIECLKDQPVQHLFRHILQNKGGGPYHVLWGCRGLAGSGTIVGGILILTEAEYRDWKKGVTPTTQKLYPHILIQSGHPHYKATDFGGSESKEAVLSMYQARLIDLSRPLKDRLFLDLARLENRLSQDDLALQIRTRGKDFETPFDPETIAHLERVVRSKGMEVTLVAGCFTPSRRTEFKIVNGLVAFNKKDFQQWERGRNAELYPRIELSVIEDTIYINSIKGIITALAEAQWFRMGTSKGTRNGNTNGSNGT